MSYWISLVMPDGSIVQVPSFSEGGTYAIGGSTEADLNVTWNYCPFYYQHLDKDEGIKWLQGKKAKDTIDRLETAVKALGTEQSNDYWQQTSGNAGYALNILLQWAKLAPEAEWNVN